MCREFVDQADLLEACRILVRLDLHLHVVLQVETDLSSHTLARSTVDTDVVGRVLHIRHITVGIRLLIGLIVTVTGVAEVRCVTEADRRCDDVTDGLYLIAKEFAAGGIETIELRVDIE